MWRKGGRQGYGIREREERKHGELRRRGTGNAEDGGIVGLGRETRKTVDGEDCGDREKATAFPQSSHSFSAWRMAPLAASTV